MRQRSANLLLPLLLLICGLYFVPLTLLGPGLSLIPGDMGDARFNNYILEHGYKFFTGQTPAFWNAPFLYPYPDVTALSDNLLGTLPLYSVFRAFCDRETAFQYWILGLYALNYCCCYFALKKWSGSTLLSAAGAYIFAFSIFNVMQMFHVQVLPRFMVPLVLYWCWNYLQEKQVRYFVYLLLGLVYQFYCGIYLGFLLAYVLLFFLLAYILVFRDRGLLRQFRNRKTILLHITALVLAIAVLLPVMLPYIHVSKLTGMRKFEEVFDTIPRLRSYFFTAPTSLTWSKLLYPHSAYAFPLWWNHFLFIGILPWLAVVVAPFLLRSKKLLPERKKQLLFFVLALFLCVIFCLNVGGFTLYRLIFALPGFSSMRSLDRLINVEIILFVLVFVFVCRELSLFNRAFRIAMLCLPVLVVADNLIDHWELKNFEKKDAQEAVRTLREQMQQQGKGAEAVFYTPVQTYSDNKDELYFRRVYLATTAMLAAQDLNVPCVNGYSGFFPGNSESVFYFSDDRTLQDWCDFTHADIHKIKRVNELGKPIVSWKRVQLLASNHKYLSAQEGEQTYVTADKDSPSTWETFSLICFENGECLLKGDADLFLSAQLDGNAEITASRPKAAGWESFTLVHVSDDKVAFKAGNGKFLCYDPASLRLYATADAIGETSTFTLTEK